MKEEKKTEMFVMHHLQVASVQGHDGKSAQAKRNKAWFFELHADDAVAALNQVPSTTSTEFKKAAKAFFDLNNGELPSDEDLEHLISQDLDLKNERDCALFEWHQMVWCQEPVVQRQIGTNPSVSVTLCPNVPLKTRRSPMLRPKQRLAPSGSARAMPSVGRSSSRLVKWTSTRARFSTY